MNDNNRNDLVIVGAVGTAGVVAVAVNEIKVAVVVTAVKVDIIMETKAVGEMIRWAGIMVIYGFSAVC